MNDNISYTKTVKNVMKMPYNTSDENKYSKTNKDIMITIKIIKKIWQ